MPHAYETNRLNLPFVGHCTFAKQPVCTDWDKIDADVAVLGVPYDMGTQYRSGARASVRAPSARPRPCSHSAIAALMTSRTTRSTCRPIACASSMSAMRISSTPTR